MMGIITIWYLIPALLSIAVVYRLAKKEEADMKDFIKGVGLCLLPIFNVFIFIALFFFVVADFITTNEKVQNFLNRKL